MSWETTKRWIDALSGLSVIATMVFIALQWQEMRSGSADTHDLAVAAKAQADAARAQADDSRVIAESGRSQAANTEKLASASMRQADAALTQANNLRQLVNTNREILETTRKNFLADQRPYVWVTPHEAAVAVNQKMTWDIEFANYGRSPAVKVHPCFIFENGFPGVFKGNENIIPPIETQLKLLQSSPPKSPKECLPVSAYATQSVSVMPPGYSEHSTFLSTRPMTEADVSVFQMVKGYAFLYGSIFYEDTNGNHYMSTFCVYRLPSSAPSYCPMWNEIK